MNDSVILDKIAWHLSAVYKCDLTEAETAIADLLVETGRLEWIGGDDEEDEIVLNLVRKDYE